MNAAPAAIIRYETRISVVINMALSAAFFFGAFGASPRSLTLAAPDKFALDFLPQSLAIGFFAALVPALLVGGKRRKGLVDGLDVNADPARRVVARAVLAAAICGLVGALIAFLLPMIADKTAYYSALAAKLIYGGLLAMLVTPRALRLALS